MPPENDPTAFRNFELAGWEEGALGYHRHFERLTRQAIGSLLRAADIHEGMDVLDVATGGGYVAAAAADLGARPIGVDFAESQVELARERHPGLQFETGDACELRFADGTFDAVVMNFGLLHFAEPERALAEAFRVLRSGGRIAFTVWAAPDQCVGLRMFLRAVESHGDTSVPLPPGPSFFRFSDAEECRTTLQAAGFDAPSIEQVAQTWAFQSADGLYQAIADGTVRTRALLRGQTPKALAAIQEALRREAPAYERDGEFSIPMPATLASARKP